jgi:hypothetical protein
MIILNFIEYFIGIVFSMVILTAIIIFIGPDIIGDIIRRVNGTGSIDIIINNFQIPFFVMQILYLIIIVALLCILHLFITWVIKRRDTYTYEEKYIQVLLKNKENKYNKLKKKIYFLKD